MFLRVLAILFQYNWIGWYDRELNLIGLGLGLDDDG